MDILLKLVEETVGPFCYRILVGMTNGIVLMTIAGFANYDNQILYDLLFAQFLHGFATGVAALMAIECVAKWLIRAHSVSIKRAALVTSLFSGMTSFLVAFVINWQLAGVYWWVLPLILFFSAPYFFYKEVLPLLTNK